MLIILCISTKENAFFRIFIQIFSIFVTIKPCTKNNEIFGASLLAEDIPLFFVCGVSRTEISLSGIEVAWLNSQTGHYLYIFSGYSYNK